MKNKLETLFTECIRGNHAHWLLFDSACSFRLSLSSVSHPAWLPLLPLGIRLQFVLNYIQQNDTMAEKQRAGSAFRLWSFQTIWLHFLLQTEVAPDDYSLLFPHLSDTWRVHHLKSKKGLSPTFPLKKISFLELHWELAILIHWGSVKFHSGLGKLPGWKQDVY